MRHIDSDTDTNICTSTNTNTGTNTNTNTNNSNVNDDITGDGENKNDNDNDNVENKNDAYIPPVDEAPYPKLTFKWLYKMFGNAVCPPVICAIVGAMMDHIDLNDSGTLSIGTNTIANTTATETTETTTTPAAIDWTNYSRAVAIKMALGNVECDSSDENKAHVRAEILEDLYKREEAFIRKTCSHQ